MKKPNAIFYTEEKQTYDRKTRKFVTKIGENETLFSLGIFPTKIKVFDLPKHYVRVFLYGKYAFLNVSGIKNLVYVPDFYVNHFVKDDCLLISYHGEITKIDDPDDCLQIEKYKGVDERVWGNGIFKVLFGAEKYSGYDISCILQQINEKKDYFIENYPDDAERMGDWSIEGERQWFEKSEKEKEQWNNR